jgi:lauroyl/myristoyl acyltransferase
MFWIKLFFIVIVNLALLPFYVTLAILSFILTFIPIFPTKTAKENLKNHLNVTGFSFHFFLTRLYLNYVFYAIEAFLLWPLRLTLCLLQNEEEIHYQMNEAKKISPTTGFIYLLPHVSNVEMFTLAVIELHKKLKLEEVVALAKPSKKSFVNKLLLWYRKRPGFNIIWTDKHLLLNMNACIQQGKTIGMLVDQKPKTGGVFLKFFEKHAAFPTSGLRFCLNKNMIAFYLFGHRILPGVVKLKIKMGKNAHISSETLNPYRIQNPPSEIWNETQLSPKEKPAAKELSYFTKWMEQEIKEHPTQWCWDYRKWSRQPE